MPQQTKSLPRAGIEHLQQRPDQILDAPSARDRDIGLGDKSVRHRGRRQDKQRRLHRIAMIVELQLNLPGIEKVHLKILVVTVRGISRPKNSAILAND